jgi:hypothetical protein
MCHCVHTLISMVKMMTVYQAEICCWINTGIKYCCVHWVYFDYCRSRFKSDFSLQYEHKIGVTMWRLPIAYSFKYNQQDATLYNILYYCQCSTCFGRFLRPSSGAQELYTESCMCQARFLLPLHLVGCT